MFHFKYQTQLVHESRNISVVIASDDKIINIEKDDSNGGAVISNEQRGINIFALKSKA